MYAVFVQMRLYVGKDSAEHVFRPVKLITANIVKAAYTEQQIHYEQTSAESEKNR